MTTSNFNASNSDASETSIGEILQNLRESMQLDRKDAAAQLRLNENIINMIETNSFPDDMPPIFVRGYIRSYGRLLQLPEEEIAAAMAPPVKPAPAPAPQELQPAPAVATPNAELSKSKHLIQGLSFGIFLILVFLVAAWWHARTSTPAIDHANVVQVSELADAAAPAGVSVMLAKPAEQASASAVPAYAAGAPNKN
jgi:cytoskeleton protein RodZ